MDPGQLQTFVEGPLRLLRQCRYASLIPVREVRFTRCEYGEWNRIADEEGWIPYNPDTGFGGPDYRAIFRMTIEPPRQWIGKRVRLKVESGDQDIWNYNNPQFLVFFDTEVACGLDVHHTEVDLPDKERIDVALYGYVSSEKPDTFLDIGYYLVNEELEALLSHLTLAYETALTVESFSEAYLVLSTGCVEAIKAIDFTSREAACSPEGCARAREKLASILSSHRQCSQISIAVTGHSHIDMAWLWTLEQTREKALRSYANVLSLMERYPDYVFMSSQMQLLAFVEEEMPSLYARICRRIEEGRWEVEGGMWIESDVILPSGESLVRQIYWGKRWMRERYGKESEVLWLPDCFGFPATLPQIMAGTGLRYFVTTKLGWSEQNKFPHDVFTWKGLDGSGVLAYLVSTTDYQKLGTYPKRKSGETTYNGRMNPSQLLGTWQRFQDQEITTSYLHLYGFGDGGGGPTEEMLTRHQILKDGYPGLPRTYSTTVHGFLKQLEEQHLPLPTWEGELYLEYHRGTYTTMAEIKRLNRRCEQQALRSEFFATLAWALLPPFSYPHQEFEEAWKLLCLNQFHDILPGSSIKQVYDHAFIQLEEVHALFARQEERARAALVPHLTASPEDVVVFNTLGYQRTDLCSIKTSHRAIRDEEGRIMTSAHDGESLHFLCVDIPAKGWKRYRLIDGGAETPSPFTVSASTVDTPYYEVTFAADGSIARLWDKEDRREVLTAGNVFTLSVDLPKDYDAWNIGKQGSEMQYRFDEPVTYHVHSHNALQVTLEAQWRSLKSTYRQLVTFYSHTKRIDFTLQVDWQEDHLMLRTSFAVDVHAPRASFDIAYGVCERTTHTNTSWDEAQFEVPAHKWVDLSDGKKGVALLSGQSYGYAAKGQCLSLSLLRAPTYPNPEADRGNHSFIYSLFPHHGGWEEGGVVDEGWALHQPLIAMRGVPGTSDIASPSSFLSLDDSSLTLETIKKAEDRSSIILKIINPGPGGCTARLRCALPIREAYRCSLVEERGERLLVEENHVSLAMHGHQILCLELVV
jgi:alpha-mannosidase